MQGGGISWSPCVQEGREHMAPADRGSACIVIHYNEGEYALQGDSQSLQGNSGRRGGDKGPTRMHLMHACWQCAHALRLHGTNDAVVDEGGGGGPTCAWPVLQPLPPCR